MANVNQLNQIFRNKDLTFDTIAEAKEVYKTIANDAYKSGKWTQYNIAMVVLNKQFIRLLDNLKDNDNLKSYVKIIFPEDSGSAYNASVSTQSEDGTFENKINIKFKSIKMLENLIENYDFHLKMD